MPMFHPQGPTLRELAVQALSSTERGYDLLAPKFDYTPFRTPEEILVPALSNLDRPRSIAAALDMCCGTGAALHICDRCVATGSSASTSAAGCWLSPDG